MNIQGWFPLGWTGLISLPSKGLARVFSTSQFESINSLALSFLYKDFCPVNLFCVSLKTLNPAQDPEEVPVKLCLPNVSGLEDSCRGLGDPTHPRDASWDLRSLTESQQEATVLSPSASGCLSVSGAQRKVRILRHSFPNSVSRRKTFASISSLDWDCEFSSGFPLEIAPGNSHYYPLLCQYPFCICCSSSAFSSK